MFVSGRFVLVDDKDPTIYITSWDTWEEAEAAFESNGITARMPLGFRLIDDATGRVWYPGAKYYWDDAAT